MQQHAVMEYLILRVFVVFTLWQVHLSSSIKNEYYIMVYADLTFLGLNPISMLTNVATRQMCASICMYPGEVCKAFSYKDSSDACVLYESCPDTSCHPSLNDPGVKTYCIGNSFSFPWHINIFIEKMWFVKLYYLIILVLV